MIQHAQYTIVNVISSFTFCIKMGLASHYCRSEVIDQFFQDKFSLPESDISRHEGEKTYAYLGSHEVDLSTVASLKSAVTSDAVASLSPT